MNAQPARKTGKTRRIPPNIGFGNRARRRKRDSPVRQTSLVAEQLRNQIATEVAESFRRTRLRREQMDQATPRIASARRSLELILEGIRGLQLRLLRSIGAPPRDSVGRPEP